MAGKKGTKKTAFSFETAMTRLESIVSDLEGGELSLEDSLKSFEEGVSLVKDCQSYLGKAKQRIEVLLGDGPDGSPLIDVYEEDVEDDD